MSGFIRHHSISLIVRGFARKAEGKEAIVKRSVRNFGPSVMRLLVIVI